MNASDRPGVPVLGKSANSKADTLETQELCDTIMTQMSKGISQRCSLGFGHKGVCLLVDVEAETEPQS